MIVQRLVIVLFLATLCATAQAEKRRPSPKMSLVDETLSFLLEQAIDPRTEAAFLRAGAVRVCGEKFDRPGCCPADVTPPAKGAMGPEATDVWRKILVSAMRAEAKRLGDDFDKVSFQRFIMDGMVEALGDPASFYVVPSVYRKISSIPDDFVGFGIRVVPDKGALMVRAVHPGSPAARSGLIPGDRIVKVNGRPVTGYQRPLALAAIWGGDGNEVKFAVESRDGGKRKLRVLYRKWEFKPFSVERKAEIVIASVRHFGRGLTRAVRKALDQPTKGIVIDIRGSASGDEIEMRKLADLLVGAGSIGSRQTRLDLGNRTWKAAAGSTGERLDIPVVVAADEHTSGLAEVLAAAFARHERALIVGRTTAGEDTLGTMRLFRDGSAIQITSTRLFGPDGAALSAGVEPHLDIPAAGAVMLATAVVEKVEGSSLEELLAVGREVSK